MSRKYKFHNPEGALLYQLCSNPSSGSSKRLLYRVLLKNKRNLTLTANTCVSKQGSKHSHACSNQ